jgi:hypothetical protein
MAIYLLYIIELYRKMSVATSRLLVSAIVLISPHAAADSNYNNLDL